MALFRIKNITEAEFGCEEHTDGPHAILILENGSKVEVTEKWIAEYGIEEGKQVWIDDKGNVTKAFMLPQRNPRRFYRERFFSFNVPDFVIGPTHFDSHQAARLINDESRKSFGVRQ